MKFFGGLGLWRFRPRGLGLNYFWKIWAKIWVPYWFRLIRKEFHRKIALNGRPLGWPTSEPILPGESLSEWPEIVWAIKFRLKIFKNHWDKNLQIFLWGLSNVPGALRQARHTRQCTAESNTRGMVPVLLWKAPCQPQKPFKGTRSKRKEVHSWEEQKRSRIRKWPEWCLRPAATLRWPKWRRWWWWLCSGLTGLGCFCWWLRRHLPLHHPAKLALRRQHLRWPCNWKWCTQTLAFGEA